MTAAGGRFQEVDVLRGGAALLVVLSHYFPYWDRYLAELPVVVPNDLGYYAVKLFFAISGFVIFMTLERCTTLLDFAVLRFSRLYPAYWASLLLVALLSTLLFGEKLWLGGLVVNATMLQGFLGYPNFDNVYWSLVVELAFYLNVGWLFALKLHGRVHLIVLGWLLLAVAWAVATGSNGAVILETAAGGRDWFALLLAVDYAPYFAIGMLFYDANRHGWRAATILLLAAALAVELLLAGSTGLAVAVAVTALFALAVNGYLRFLVFRGALWLGAISYSLYLVHRNLGYHALSWLHAHGFGPAAGIGIALVGALLLATALAFAVEKPALVHVRRWYKRWHEPAGARAPRSPARDG